MLKNIDETVRMHPRKGVDARGMRREAARDCRRHE